MSVRVDPTDAGAVERACAIDLGTNSFHAVLFEFGRDRVPKVVDRLKEPVGLGAGSLSAGALTHEAVRRAVRALARIQMLAKRRRAVTLRAYATSAIREASNGDAFIAHVRRELRLDVQPIPGEREAELIYLGVRDAVDLTAPSLLVDIGGGSTELVVADRESIRYARSLKLGAARLTDAFVTTDPLSAEERTALEAHLESSLAPVFAAARQHGARRLVGSSGTMENLGRLAHTRAGRAGTVFQHELTPKEVSKVVEELVGSTRAERARMASLDEHRVDQIVAGAMLVRCLLKSLELDAVVLSPAALREGMVVELVRERGEELARLLDEPDLGRRRFLELGMRHRFDEPHGRHVSVLAMRLFDELAPLHALDERARTVLDRAALVHDIGHAVSGRRHHKHSRYIIEQAAWPGIDPEEVKLVALVARYHRKAPPRKRHKRFKRLDKPTRSMVAKLSALLRLANALDRSHVQNTEDLQAVIRHDAVHVTITTRAEPDLELHAARGAGELFERAFGRRLELRSAWLSHAV